MPEHPSAQSLSQWAHGVDDARVALTGRLDLIEERTAGLSAEVASLQARVSALEEASPLPIDPPPPDLDEHPMVSGPHFAGTGAPVGSRLDLPRDAKNEPPNIIPPLFDLDLAKVQSTATRGAAPLWREGPTIRVRLAAEDQTPAHGGATGTHELHFILERRQQKLKTSCSFYLIDTPAKPYDPGRTGKWWGAVNFDGNWAEWPGGGGATNHGPSNSMFRLFHWWWNRQGDGTQGEPGSSDRYRNTSWRHGILLNLGGKDDVRRVVAIDRDGNPARHKYFYSNGHGGEWLLHTAGAPRVSEWWTATMIADPGHPGVHDGSLEIYINNMRHLTLTNIRWCIVGEGGWNRGYTSFMHGGGPGFEPQNPERATEVLYRNLTYEWV